MGQNVTELLTDAVRTFNARVSHAREKGVPFLIQSTRSSDHDGGGGDHIHVLRTVPMSANVPLEARDLQCAAEIALFGAAGEINRLADEARRQKVVLQLKVEAAGEQWHAGRISLVLPGLRGQ